MHEHHDELFDEGGAANVHRFCCPILIGDFRFGAFLEPPAHFLVQPGEELPRLRSGTLTFVRYRGEIYGVTCAHVIDALDKAIEKDKQHFYCLIGSKSPYPPEVWKRFFFPRGGTHVDVNVQFERAPDPEADLAAGWIPPDIFSAIGREAIDLTADSDLTAEWLTEVGAIATGYPEANRRIYCRSKPDDTLAISNVTLHAGVERPIGRKIRMIAPLPVELSTEVDVLSGMSGGPLIATIGGRWHLIGIVSGGYDIHSYARPNQAGFFDSPAINIEAELLEPRVLRPWLETLAGRRSGRATYNVKMHLAGRTVVIA